MAESNVLEQHFQECMPLFIALGDEVRLKIIDTLSKAVLSDRPEGLNVNEITCQTSLSRPAISHHLKILRDTGLVEVTQAGTANYYRPTLIAPTQRLMKLGRLVEEYFQKTESA